MIKLNEKHWIWKYFKSEDEITIETLFILGIYGLAKVVIPLLLLGIFITVFSVEAVIAVIITIAAIIFGVVALQWISEIKLVKKTYGKE